MFFKQTQLKTVEACGVSEKAMKLLSLRKEINRLLYHKLLVHRSLPHGRHIKDQNLQVGGVLMWML